MLNTDYILLDEAQDTNPVVLGVLAGQRAQVVYVGDPYQQIYEWRGAINAMDKMPGCEETALTQSFRFGEAIAAEASRLLATLGEHRQVRGNPETTSVVATSGTAEAVLARTNATVILEILEATGVGRRPHVCGGTEAIKRLLSDVYELKAGRPAVSPEFFGFQNWCEVVEFANCEEGQDLRTFVQLVQQNGEGKLWAAVNKAVANEHHADVILSTAHKAKGREWNAVRLADDFVSGRLGPDPDAEVGSQAVLCRHDTGEKSADRRTANAAHVHDECLEGAAATSSRQHKPAGGWPGTCIGGDRGVAPAARSQI